MRSSSGLLGVWSAGGLGGIWGARGTLLGSYWGPLGNAGVLPGVQDGVLWDGELLGSTWRSRELGTLLGVWGAGSWEIAGCSALSGSLIQPLPGYQCHLTMPGPLLAATGMDLALPAQGQQGAGVGSWQPPSKPSSPAGQGTRHNRQLVCTTTRVLQAQ